MVSDLKNLMPVWKEKEPSSFNFYENMMHEEYVLRKLIKISELILNQTIQSIKNDLSEELHKMVRKSVYPAITFPDIPESDYKTINEKLRERKEAPNGIQYTRAIWAKMEDVCRKSYGKDPEYRNVGNQHHKKYLEKDFDQ